MITKGSMFWGLTTVRPHVIMPIGRIKQRDTVMIAIQKYVFTQYAKCAEKRGISFNINAETFMALASAPCAYCTACNTNKAVRAQYAVKEWSYNGVDRVNSELPYAIGNVVSCCKACNAAKSAMSLDKFMSSDWLKNRITSVKG